MNGTVSNVITAKGYGFISGDDNREYFFHKDEIDDWQGLVDAFFIFGGGKIKVTFDAMKAPKGPRAKSVVVIEE